MTRSHDDRAGTGADRGGAILPAITLSSVPFCPRLQRAKVALAARGGICTEQDAPDVWPMPEGYPRMVLRHPDGSETLHLRSIPMIEAIEALFPAHPLYPHDPAAKAADQALMRLGRGLQLRLSDVTHAADSVAHDMAVFRLTSRLRLIEGVLAEEFPRVHLDNPGVVFAPTLWRIRLLDREAGTFLLHGLPRLTDWAEMLSAEPALRIALGHAAEAVYLSRVRARNTVLMAEADRALWARWPNGPA